jgi:hypothetical protein
MSLEVPERQEYVRMLAERIEADNQASEQLAELLKRR